MKAKNIIEWRKSVLLRDNFTCQICGKSANIADHIVARKLEPELLLETDNGRALCNSCHAKHGTKVYIVEKETLEDRISNVIPKPRLKTNWENQLEITLLMTAGSIRTLASIENKSLQDFLPGKTLIIEFTEYGKICRIV